MSTSAVSQFPMTSTSASCSIGESSKDQLVISPRNFLFLIPTITAIAMGSIFLPHFGLGLAVGACDLMFTVVGCVAIDRMGILSRNEDKNSQYEQMLRKALLQVSVFSPIAEEGVFRGIVQPFLTRVIQVLVPGAAAALFGPAFSTAVVVSTVVSSIFFGALHYLNPHKNSHIQAVSATIGGLVYGFLSAQFGIGASIAAHIANNTIVSCIIALLPENKNANFDASPLPA